jgi:hypothetical protein
MSENDPILDDIAQALQALAGRLDAIEKRQESILDGLSRERETHRQSLGLLIQFLERQTASLKQIEAKVAEGVAIKRQAMVKGQVVIGKPKPPVEPQPAQRAEPSSPLPPSELPLEALPEPIALPEPEPLPPPFQPSQPAQPLQEIEQQISEAIGNISAMLKKKEGRRKKSG